MSIAQDFNRLGEEIARAYEERHLLKEKLHQDCTEIRRDTADLLGTLSEARCNMAQALRSEFAQFQTCRTDAEKDRQDHAMAENQKRSAEVLNLRHDVQCFLKDLEKAHHEMGAQLTSTLEQFMAQFSADAADDATGRMKEIQRRKADIMRLRDEAQLFLKEMAAIHQEMGEQLKSELKQFMTDFSDQAKSDSDERLHACETRRVDVNFIRQELQRFLHELHKTRMAMEAALRSEMKAFEEERKAGVQDFLLSVGAEHREMAAAWQGVLAMIRSLKGGDAKDFAGEEQFNPVAETKSPEEEGKGQQPEEIADPGNMNDLMMKIAQTLKNHSDGLKMTQVAEVLHVDQWRMLIPIMRDLQDTGLIRKEGSLYFSD